MADCKQEAKELFFECSLYTSLQLAEIVSSNKETKYYIFIICYFDTLLKKMGRKSCVTEIHEASGQGCISQEYKLEEYKRCVTVRKCIGLLLEWGRV
jgi:hypothetical protein